MYSSRIIDAQYTVLQYTCCRSICNTDVSYWLSLGKKLSDSYTLNIEPQHQHVDSLKCSLYLSYVTSWENTASDWIWSVQMYHAHMFIIIIIIINKLCHKH